MASPTRGAVHASKPLCFTVILDEPGASGSRDADRLARGAGAAGVRDDGGRARAVHVPGVRQGADARQAGVVRHGGAQRRAQGGGPRHGPLAQPQPPRRDLHPGPADHER